jgi:GntR family transcriptional regulator, transcriptional repressor for pyruvate dehydrogenase complex
VTTRRPPNGARFRSPRRGASEQVAFEIRQYLSSRDLQPGERLGTEQELAAEFGVSRPTLREGLRLLASSHLIRASQGPGGGIFVESTQSEGMRRSVSESIAVMLETDSVSLIELVEARISLEVPLAGLAAQRATETTAAELLEAIAEAEGNHPAADAFRVADTRLHRVIASAARNELLRAFTSWTLDVLQPSLIDTIGGSIDGDAILHQHRVIQRAIRLRQPAAAQRAMRRHLEYLRELVDALDAPASPKRF